MPTESDSIEGRIRGNLELAAKLVRAAREERTKVIESLKAHEALMQAAHKAKAERRVQLDQELKALAQQWATWTRRKPPSGEGKC